MRRRDFLKGLFGLAAAPFVPLAAKLIAKGTTGDAELDELVKFQADVQRAWDDGAVSLDAALLNVEHETFMARNATTVVDRLHFYASDFGWHVIKDPQAGLTKWMNDEVDELSAVTPHMRGKRG